MSAKGHQVTLDEGDQNYLMTINPHQNGSLGLWYPRAYAVVVRQGDITGISARLTIVNGVVIFHAGPVDVNRAVLLHMINAEDTGGSA